LTTGATVLTTGAGAAGVVAVGAGAGAAGVVAVDPEAGVAGVVAVDPEAGAAGVVAVGAGAGVATVLTTGATALTNGAGDAGCRLLGAAGIPVELPPAARACAGNTSASASSKTNRATRHGWNAAARPHFI
jgi:hypothetical protein